jgi:hypothetical protein
MVVVISLQWEAPVGPDKKPSHTLVRIHSVLKPPTTKFSRLWPCLLRVPDPHHSTRSATHNRRFALEALRIEGMIYDKFTVQSTAVPETGIATLPFQGKKQVGQTLDRRTQILVS